MTGTFKGGWLREMWKRLGKGLLVVYNALLVGKRVVVLGTDEAVEEISRRVLALARLFSPPFTPSAFLAGVYPFFPNYSFESGGWLIGTDTLPDEKSYDVLYDLQDGSLKSERFTSSIDLSKFSHYDDLFYNNIQKYMQTSTPSETKLQSFFHSYTYHLAELVLEKEDSDSQKEEWESNSVRLEMMRSTPFYKHYRESKSHKKFKDPHIPLYIRRLRVKKTMTDSDLIRYYKAFKESVGSSTQLDDFEFLLPPESGLNLLGTGLLHTSEKVRFYAIGMFTHFNELLSGKLATRMNSFYYLTYVRLVSRTETPIII
eukprot:TRINITY_DN644_c2_g1_i3.p1 TRINITY_DN644_c2_g1~~TRINITY_DN644_c2_g1_i3.p1  ORF type:complete len:315 (-),score=67.60 TRINITY_DN644_c2_g1_i3:12-956(-)